MRVLGIGNAIIDVICKVEEKFITENNLTKGTMKLFFDEIEFKSLLGSLKTNLGFLVFEPSFSIRIACATYSTF